MAKDNTEERLNRRSSQIIPKQVKDLPIVWQILLILATGSVTSIGGYSFYSLVDLQSRIAIMEENNKHNDDNDKENGAQWEALRNANDELTELRIRNLSTERVFKMLLDQNKIKIYNINFNNKAPNRITKTEKDDKKKLEAKVETEKHNSYREKQMRQYEQRIYPNMANQVKK